MSNNRIDMTESEAVMLRLAAHQLTNFATWVVAPLIFMIATEKTEPYFVSMIVIMTIAIAACIANLPKLLSRNRHNVKQVNVQPIQSAKIVNFKTQTG